MPPFFGNSYFYLVEIISHLKFSVNLEFEKNRDKKNIKKQLDNQDKLCRFWQSIFKPRTS